MIKKIFHSQEGFSLVEIILVIMVVGFTVLLINNLPSSIGLIGKSNFSSIAKDIATQKIEDERSLTFDNLANGTFSITDSRLSNLPQGMGTLTVTDCPGTVCTLGEQVKQVTAVINWVESGDPKNLQVSTFIAQGGLR